MRERDSPIKFKLGKSQGGRVCLFLEHHASIMQSDNKARDELTSLVFLRLSPTSKCVLCPSGVSRPTPAATPLPTLPNLAGLFFTTLLETSISWSPVATMVLMVPLLEPLHVAEDLVTNELAENAVAVDNIVRMVAVVNLMVLITIESI